MAEYLHRLERLEELTRTLSAALDVEAFLHSLTEAACELTSSESVSVLRYDAAADNLKFVAAPFFLRDKLLGIVVPLEGSAAGWAFQYARPLVLNDAVHGARYFHEIDALTGIPTRSVLAVPLMFRGGPLGVLEAVNKLNDAHYTEEDVAVLESLAALASFALRERDLQERLTSSAAEVALLDRLKSDFIAITSHELRTPLGLILGHATFLRELAGEELHEQLDTVIRNATRLKEIVESLSHVDNYESGAARIRQRSFSLATIVREVTESFQEQARGKGVSLHTIIDAGPLTVEGEAGKISLALGNLIQNAVAFTDSGGQVTVSAEALEGYVKVAVADTGIGIPAQDLGLIFDKFFQVDSHLTRKHGGMGLGLSVAKAMIELHGGRIAVESIEGKGTTISFLLPVRAEQVSGPGKMLL